MGLSESDLRESGVSRQEGPVHRVSTDVGPRALTLTLPKTGTEWVTRYWTQA